MSESDFLFARPSFIEGMARLLDLGATLQEYNRSITPIEADARALYNDFRAVGEDMKRAMTQFAGDHNLPCPPSTRKP